MARTIVESKTKTAIIGFDEPFCVIGERINPTGRKKLASELEAGDFTTVERDALAQVAAGANILDINALDLQLLYNLLFPFLHQQLICLDYTNQLTFYQLLL